MKYVFASYALLVTTAVGATTTPRTSLPLPSCVATTTIVQSLPVGGGTWNLAHDAIDTYAALIDLVNSSSTTLDFTAMYMDLIGTADRVTWSAEQMKAFGADRGYALFDALRAAAKRGVAMRILLGTLNDPLNSTEIVELRQYPNVEARSWDPKLWYGGGIMHMKVWVGDGRAAYLGSANADWKSLAQVKELGVLHNDGPSRCRRTVKSENENLSSSPTLVAEVAKLFEVFWEWSDPARAVATVTAFSPAYLATLTLPPWDLAVPAATRAKSPFSAPALASLHGIATPFPLGPSGGSAFVSSAPDGTLTGVRARDEDALVYTLHDAQASASLSVMDFKPASGYSGGRGGSPVHWPALTNAILALAYARPVKIRLLISFWAHTDKSQPLAMKRLAEGMASCAGAYQSCAGSLEVRQYIVPGWNETASGELGEELSSRDSVATPAWPAFTRVNHAKYIVTDRRVNFGTSNWQWGYFHNTAGASLNTNDTALVAGAQSVFDADWNSPYSVPLEL